MNIKRIILIIGLWILPQVASAVSISEVLPNPHGKDDHPQTGEYIELYNSTEAMINLSGYCLATSKKQYCLADQSIDSKQYLLLRYPATDLQLVNKGDQLKLFNSNGGMVSQLTWGQAAGGVAFTTGGVATEVPTPGKANVVASLVAEKKAVTSSSGKYYQPATVSEALRMNPKTYVTVAGSVIAPPNTTLSKVFILGDGAEAVRVYFGKRAVGEMERWQRVEIRAKVGADKYGPKLYLEDAGDLKILGEGEGLDPLVINNTEELALHQYNWVQVGGELERASTTELEIGGVEVKMTGEEDWPTLAAGDEAVVQGVAYLSGETWQVRPLAVTDVTYTIKARSEGLVRALLLRSEEVREVVDPWSSLWLGWGISVVLLVSLITVRRTWLS